MKTNERRAPDPEPPSSGPLSDLVDDKLNRPLPEKVAREIEAQEEEDERPRAGATDYARGTAEHEDDQDA